MVVPFRLIVCVVHNFPARGFVVSLLWRFVSQQRVRTVSYQLKTVKGVKSTSAFLCEGTWAGNNYVYVFGSVVSEI